MVDREGFRYAELLQQRHTKYGRIRGMVVGEGGRSTGVLLYTQLALYKIFLQRTCFDIHKLPLAEALTPRLLICMLNPFLEQTKLDSLPITAACTLLPLTCHLYTVENHYCGHAWVQLTLVLNHNNSEETVLQGLTSFYFTTGDYFEVGKG